MSLERVYTITELAAMTKWNPQRLRRRLLAMNEHMGGALLRNTAHPGKRPHYTTTLSALRAIAPQWFRDDEAIENRIEELEVKADVSTKMLEAAGNRIALLTQKIKSVETKCSVFEESLRAIVG